MRCIRAIAASLVLVALTGTAGADKAAYLDLAQKGWNYRLRAAMVARGPEVPTRISGQTLRGAALCLVGEAPDPNSVEVIDTFRALSASVFGTPLTMRHAGASARDCGTEKTVVLRLYSGPPPDDALSDDLAWMNEVYDLGLPRGRHYRVMSPGIGQTFFGRRGQPSHIMVQQAGLDAVGTTEALYFRSILVEELFQVFTFGIDIVQRRSGSVFLSKLQENPYRTQALPWASRAFMRGLLQATPSRLCAFDIFMMHAVAQAPVNETNSDAFIAYIDADYNRLIRVAAKTLVDPRFAPIIDPDCRASGG